MRKNLSRQQTYQVQKLYIQVQFKSMWQGGGLHSKLLWKMGKFQLIHYSLVLTTNNTRLIIPISSTAEKRAKKSVVFFLFVRFINVKRMKTSIRSKPFVALPTDRRTKYLQNRCSFMKGICTRELFLIQGPRKSRFPLNLEDRHIDIQTDRRADICFYRVALLLKRKNIL